MNYELVYILSPKLTEEEVKRKTKEIAKLLEKNEAKIEKEDFWGKREFAYPIKHFNSGFYVQINFLAEPEQIGKIDKALKLEEEILRFLIIKKEKALEKKEEKPKIEKTEEKEKAVSVVSKEKSASGGSAHERKVKIKELDKKLGEILGE